MSVIPFDLIVTAGAMGFSIGFLVGIWSERKR